jgi:hypothetical protein
MKRPVYPPTEPPPTGLSSLSGMDYHPRKAALGKAPRAILRANGATEETARRLLATAAQHRDLAEKLGAGAESLSGADREAVLKSRHALLRSADAQERLTVQFLLMIAFHYDVIVAHRKEAKRITAKSRRRGGKIAGAKKAKAAAKFDRDFRRDVINPRFLSDYAPGMKKGDFCYLIQELRPGVGLPHIARLAGRWPPNQNKINRLKNLKNIV